jgi:hypothetical protein
VSAFLDGRTTAKGRIWLYFGIRIWFGESSTLRTARLSSFAGSSICPTRSARACDGRARRKPHRRPSSATERRYRVPLQRWINGMRTERKNRRNRIASVQRSSKRKSNASSATAIGPILEAVNSVLRGQHYVALPRQGIDLLFDSGVVARCRTCELSWTVTPTQFSSIGWWSCPSGCRPSDATHRETALHGQADG